jgi:hypothetical protein
MTADCVDYEECRGAGSIATRSASEGPSLALRVIMLPNRALI